MTSGPTSTSLYNRFLQDKSSSTASSLLGGPEDNLWAIGGNARLWRQFVLTTTCTLSSHKESINPSVSLLPEMEAVFSVAIQEEADQGSSNTKLLLIGSKSYQPTPVEPKKRP